MVFQSSWSDEQINLLKKFQEEGSSASVIAYRLGEHGYRVTRNSVCGKLHRLGLSGKGKDGHKKVEQQVKVKPATLPVKHIAPQFQRKVLPRRPKGAPMSIIIPNASKQVLLRETKESDCRAIVDYRNGVLADAVCCGEQAIFKMVRGRLVRSPWCAFHNQLYTVEDRR